MDDGDLDDLRSDDQRRLLKHAPDSIQEARRLLPRSTPSQGLRVLRRQDGQIDYKEVNRLRRYLSERAKIEPRRKTGTCAAHQRELAVALKRARIVALLPYAPQHLRP